MLLRVQASGLGPAELRTLIPRHHSLPTHPVLSTTAAPEGKSVCICSAPAWDTLPHLPQACVHLPKHHRGTARPFLRALFTTAASSQQHFLFPSPSYSFSIYTPFSHACHLLKNEPHDSDCVSFIFCCFPKIQPGSSTGKAPHKCLLNAWRASRSGCGGPRVVAGYQM